MFDNDPRPSRACLIFFLTLLLLLHSISLSNASMQRQWKKTVPSNPYYSHPSFVVNQTKENVSQCHARKKTSRTAHLNKRRVSRRITKVCNEIGIPLPPTLTESENVDAPPPSRKRQRRRWVVVDGNNVRAAYGWRVSATELSSIIDDFVRQNGPQSASKLTPTTTSTSTSTADFENMQIITVWDGGVPEIATALERTNQGPPGCTACSFSEHSAVAFSGDYMKADDVIVDAVQKIIDLEKKQWTMHSSVVLESDTFHEAHPVDVSIFVFTSDKALTNRCHAVHQRELWGNQWWKNGSTRIIDRGETQRKKSKKQHNTNQNAMDDGEIDQLKEGQWQHPKKKDKSQIELTLSVQHTVYLVWLTQHLFKFENAGNNAEDIPCGLSSIDERKRSSQKLLDGLDVEKGVLNDMRNDIPVPNMTTLINWLNNDSKLV